MPRPTQCVRTPLGTFYAFRADVVTDHLLEFGAHTRNELAMLLSRLRPGDTVLDIGAHIGTYAVPIARHVGPAGRVLAIEACRETFDLLVLNVEANGLGRIVRPCWAVVADRPGCFEAVTKEANTGATFFRSVESAAEGPPSLVPDQWDLLRGRRVDALKIDVEGMEYAVLAGCAGLLRRCRPVLYVEINGPGQERIGVSRREVEALLRECGYHFFRNVGPRNSASDTFQIARLDDLQQGGEFFDLLAIPEGSERYPESWVPFDPALLQRARPSLPARIYRRLRRAVIRRTA